MAIQKISSPENLPDLEPDEEEVAKPKIVRKTRPVVEGINAPKVTSDTTFTRVNLTDREKKLMENLDLVRPSAPKLMPEKITIGKRPGHKGLWITLLVIILAAAGGYKWYAPYLPPRLNFFAKKTPTEAQPEGRQDLNLFGAEQQADGQGGSLYAPVPDTASSTSSPAASTSPENAATSSAPSAAGASAPAAATSRLRVTDTPTGYLNVRSQPSTAGALVTKIKPGEVYQYTGQKSGWYEIILPTGQSGWVSGQYVKAE